MLSITSVKPDDVSLHLWLAEKVTNPSSAGMREFGIKMFRNGKEEV